MKKILLSCVVLLLLSCAPRVIVRDGDVVKKYRVRYGVLISGDTVMFKARNGDTYHQIAGTSDEILIY